MRVYLVQHAKAKSKDEDPDRPLTDEGRAELRGVAEILRAADDVPVDRIHHSGKVRARQTASILSDVLATGAEPGEADDLGALDEPAGWAERLQETEDNVMLVGHLPYMERMAGLLLTGDPEGEPVDFRNGGVVCIERSENGWSLVWDVAPEIAGRPRS